MILRRVGRWAFIGAAVILVAGIAAAAFAMKNLLSGKTGGPVQVVRAPAEVVARGKYLAEAADCAACHSAPGGAPFAGGLPMQTGFGTIYATNITPDPDDGLGRWSAEDFWRALHDGVRRDGQQLYPAMPYTSYRGITRADADAIYAYIMQLRPMKVANRRTELKFPFNIRLGMLGWNLLFLHDSLPAVSAGSSPAWQRGRYLVNVLGHCGECHTPRGIVGEMEISRSLTGFALGRVAAPDITPAGLASRGWTAAGLRAYLGRGLARQGSAFSDMHPVIMLSTRNLTAEDLAAVATYLLGDNPPPPAPPPAVGAAESAAAANGAGRMSYVALCAGCHGLDGDGVPNTVVAMRANSTLRLVDPRNLIVAMLDGIGAENFPHRASMQAMPGFSDKLSDAEAAALANYLRATWGGQKADVTPAAVRALR
jgi:mono/diheme cytochrome c family protein